MYKKQRTKRIRQKRRKESASDTLGGGVRTQTGCAFGSLRQENSIAVRFVRVKDKKRWN